MRRCGGRGLQTAAVLYAWEFFCMVAISVLCLAAANTPAVCAVSGRCKHSSCSQGCRSRPGREEHAADPLSAPRFCCRAHRSDAILSCPLCFTTLCIDCQQHDKYDNQFRAMFVMNCR